MTHDAGCRPSAGHSRPRGRCPWPRRRLEPAPHAALLQRLDSVARRTGDRSASGGVAVRKQRDRSASPGADAEPTREPVRLRRLARDPTLSNLRRRCADRVFGQNQPVPEGYVSTCLFGNDREPAPIRPAPTTRRPASEEDLRRRRSSSRLTGAGSAPVPSSNTSPAAPDAAQAAGQPPTVRQAVEAFLASGFEDTNATAMLMLATQLGSSTRLNALEGAKAAKDLAAWFHRLYGPKTGSTRESALRTVVGAIDFGRAKGWLADDAAALLR
jgi:hypothetical protein